MCLPVHPYLVGTPHRVRYFEQVLDYVTSHDAVWLTTAGAGLVPVNDQPVTLKVPQVASTLRELRGARAAMNEEQQRRVLRTANRHPLPSAVHRDFVPSHSHPHTSHFSQQRIPAGVPVTGVPASAVGRVQRAA